jgi:serine protease
LNRWSRIGQYSAYNFGGDAVLAKKRLARNAEGERRAPDQMRRLLSIPAVAVMLTAALTATAAAKPGVGQARKFAPRQLLVKFEGQRHGHAVRLPRGVGVRRAAAALRRNRRVVYAVPNYIAHASATKRSSAHVSAVKSAATPFAVPDDDGALEGSGETGVTDGWLFKQWNFLPSQSGGAVRLTSPGGIDAPDAWQRLDEVGRPGAEGVRIAVLDSGIAYRDKGRQFLRSPDFAPGQFANGYDFVARDPVPLDENGHGTHVAGTIAEKTGNGLALTGLAYGAKLIPVRVLNRRGVGNAAVIAKGIRYAVKHHAQVINMSFNFECGQKVPMVDEALREAYAHGVVVVASGGNLISVSSSRHPVKNCVSEPATGPRVIGVGGTTEGACLGAYSLAGTAIDVVAPGGGEPIGGCPSVLSRPIFQVTLKAHSTNEFAIPSDYTGTSMAAAHVSGVAAMILASGVLGPQKSPKARVKAVTRRLRKTARDIGLPATQQGAGLIDAGAATNPEIG